jgi:hypothetical protein
MSRRLRIAESLRPRISKYERRQRVQDKDPTSMRASNSKYESESRQVLIQVSTTVIASSVEYEAEK